MIVILTKDLYIPVREMRVSNKEFNIIGGPSVCLKSGKTYENIFNKIKEAIKEKKSYVDLIDLVTLDDPQIHL